MKRFAQEDVCPELATTALETTLSTCEVMGRNQACYGNGDLEAEFSDGLQDISFDQPGDVADVTQLQSLRLFPMDVDLGTWGVALISLQANLPDTLPGQGVTFLLFGDVEMMNAETPIMTIEFVSTGNINIRSIPSTNGAIVGSLTNGETVIANQRTEAGDWVRIQREDEIIGWVFASLLTTDGDIDDLSLNESETEGNLSAYYFRTGVGDASCAEAPNSGILIQTPEGVGEVNLTLNEVILA